MNSFVSFADVMEPLLQRVIGDTLLHAKWLNTLSYMENCGARKIAACEHPTLVKREMVKHAAEEFRHAHHLKRQIDRISSATMDSYSPSSLLGGRSTLHYLNILDIKTARHLKEKGVSTNEIKGVAYLLVTYAIELRADELYPLYDTLLRKAGSRVTIKSIALEEKEHLKEMEEGLRQLPSGFAYAEAICSIEAKLCREWLDAISQNLYSYPVNSDTCS